MESSALIDVVGQVVQRSTELGLEGRAIVIGVNGLDAQANLDFVVSLKARFVSMGLAVAEFRQERCEVAAVCREIASKLVGERADNQEIYRYLEEGIDYPVVRRSIQELTLGGGVLIVEGMFLYTDALSDLFDLRLYLEVSPETARQRLSGAAKPEGQAHDGPFFDAVVCPAFQRYLAESDPASSSDYVIDMNDFCNPGIVNSVG